MTAIASNIQAVRDELAAWLKRRWHHPAAGKAQCVLHDLNALLIEENPAMVRILAEDVEALGRAVGRW